MNNELFIFFPIIYFPKERVLKRKSFDIASNFILKVLVQLLENFGDSHLNQGKSRGSLFFPWKVETWEVTQTSSICTNN